MGIVYLLHLDSPLAHARHYVGYSTNGHTLKRRLAHHERGTANCSFTNALHKAGIGFKLARTFKGVDRSYERALKNTHKVKSVCLICNPKAPKTYQPKCLHTNKIGDNYGESCEDCGKVLAGYGYGGFFGGNRMIGQKCRHRFVDSGDTTKTCMYCQLEKEK